MANEVQKEPTMEEILASIRKIISDDDTEVSTPTDSPLRAKSEDIFVDTPGNDDFEDLTFDDVDSPAAVEGLADDVEEPLVFNGDTGAALVAKFNDSEANDLSAIEEMLDAPIEEAAPEDEGVSFDIPAIEPEAEPTPQPSFEQPAAPVTPEVSPIYTPKEDSMPASTNERDTALTDDRTADAAAGALGKLISSMDVSSDNSIEGLVRAMLKPMLKEWLDANLPKIVEQKVEAEVQRIARMAR